MTATGLAERSSRRLGQKITRTRRGHRPTSERRLTWFFAGQDTLKRNFAGRVYKDWKSLADVSDLPFRY
jgi:hypothetical protein